MHSVRSICVGAASIAAGVALYGQSGAGLHRSADAIALLLPICMLAIVIGAVAASGRIVRLVFGCLAIFFGYGLLHPFVAQGPGGEFRLYSKNMLWKNTSVGALAQDVRLAQVDAAVFQEITRETLGLLALLRTEFPHQHTCIFAGRIGNAVVSRYPFVQPGRCTQTRAMAAVQIQKDGQAVWVVSTHLPWPWPVDSAVADRQAMELIASLSGAVVIAGDFNMVPWSGRVSRLARASGTRLAGPSRATYRLFGLPLPIDHVLAPDGGHMERRPLLGADHYGLVADVRLSTAVH